MTLFQISEPGESPLPHAHKRAIGIDLGVNQLLQGNAGIVGVQTLFGHDRGHGGGDRVVHPDVC